MCFSSLSDTLISEIEVVIREIYMKNRASVSQSVKECPDPQPEGLVQSVEQLGLYDCGDLKSKGPGIRIFFFFSVFIFLLFLF